jgi:hypothetical protein
MNVKSPNNFRAAENISAILSRQDVGLSLDEREARLQGIERIANPVRARRPESEGPQCIPPT